MSVLDKNVETEVRFIGGNSVADDRGVVRFVNDFDFHGVKRFYTVANHRAGFIRAWHAHRHEAKYVAVLQGAAVIGAVKIDNWKNPSRDSEVYRYVLSSHKPAVIYIPAGHANGFMALTEDTILIFFSTVTVEDSSGDDVRYHARYWDIWEVAER
ncbi:dTDP-4-dehydrorhamnose 3,5-epimerase family protein [Chloroflexota bacterium]